MYILHFTSYSSIHSWEESIWKNKRLPSWHFTSGFDFDHITALGMSLCTRLSKFIQIGPSSVELWSYIDFQDGERWGAILLPVSDWLMSFSTEDQSLSANQISSRYLNPRLRYKYFRFEKKQPFVILEFYFRFRFWPYHHTRHITVH